ncbi:MAG: glutamate synthase central domain-containing protein [Edaphobacter sp.]
MAALAKVMSKMGISVVDSYRGAHLFDILGLHSSVVARCFVILLRHSRGLDLRSWSGICGRHGSQVGLRLRMS